MTYDDKMIVRPDPDCPHCQGSGRRTGFSEIDWAHHEDTCHCLRLRYPGIDEVIEVAAEIPPLIYGQDPFRCGRLT